MKKHGFKSTVFLFLFIAGVCSSQAGTKTWRANTTGNWFTVANWAEGGDYPRAGDDVVITNVGSAVLLTNSTEYLSSLTLRTPGLSANTLVFSNWNTTLSATNITIQTNGVVTLPATFTAIAGVMSNNVYIICSNLTIDTGGKIDVKGKGYSGATNQNLNGFGPGRGLGGGPGGGAGYGSFGYGSIGLFGRPYGSAAYPFQPGSGGGTYNTTDGGSGGGAVRIEATGTVTVNGTINADGNNGDTSGGGGGGGSGGGIYIACLKLAGTGGQVTAIGGNGDNEDPYAGGASGGRIAVHYNTAAQTSMPAIQFLCSGGIWGANRSGADMGTLWLTNSTFITKEFMLSGHKTQVIVPGFTSWTVDTLTVSNTTIRFAMEGFQLNVTGDLTVGASGSLGLDGSVAYVDYTLIPYPTLSGLTSAPALNVGGNLLLTNGGTLYMYSAMTNSAAINYGARIAVSGNIFIATNAVLYLQSHPTNGGSVFITANNLTVNTGGVINAVGRGYAGGPSANSGFGPGRATSTSAHSGSGAGYGGTGGISYASQTRTGNPYGLTNGPLQAGSGGAGGIAGGAGGGLIWIRADGTVTVNGALKADGVSGAGGGGSGGGIYVTCRTIAGGANGSLSAKGSDAGSSWSGGGGGGRIAVWSIRNNTGGLISTNVLGGAGGGEAHGLFAPLDDGTPGTVVLGQLPVPGTVFFGR